MALFVHEFFCSGAFAGDLRQSSLAVEGLAMLRALLKDLSRAPSAVRAVTTLDRRLKDRQDLTQENLTQCADIRWADSSEHERRLFQKLAAESEGTLVIAPETGDCLLERRLWVDAAGGRFLGHSAEAIRLCTDKQQFADHLSRHGLPTIPTSGFDLFANNFSFPFPMMVKPRDGAGSQDTFLICDREKLDELEPVLISIFGRSGSQAIAQPYIPGRSLSVAALVNAKTGVADVFPVGEQRLSEDGRFRYRGGSLPARMRGAIDIPELIRTTCASIPGASGYIGFDLILEENSDRILIVEANPRLTTAYLGYRELTSENLAERIVNASCDRPAVKWRDAEIEFDADGAVRYRMKKMNTKNGLTQRRRARRV